MNGCHTEQQARQQNQLISPMGLGFTLCFHGVSPRTIVIRITGFAER
jgi:hypothetical protein